MKGLITMCKTSIQLIAILLLCNGAANASFPTTSGAYTSTNFANTNKAPRTLYYASGGTANVLTLIDKGNRLSLSKGPKSITPLFSATVTSNKQYSNEKRKFASESANDLLSLKQDKKEFSNEVAELKLKVSKTKSNDDKADYLQEINALNSEIKKINAEIRRVEQGVATYKNLPILSLDELFSKQPNSRFFILQQGTLSLIVPNQQNTSLNTNITGAMQRGSQSIYTVKSSLKIGSTRVHSDGSTLLHVEKVKDTVTEIRFAGKTYQLMRIEDEKVKAMSDMAKRFPTSPTSFSFKGETLTTSYVWNKSGGGAKKLLVEYKYTGKKKNLIQVKAQAETELFDPKTTSSNTEKHIGIMAKTKSGSLLELKKVQKVLDKVESSWVLDNKNRIIKLGEEILFVSKENYYGFEGLWYLAYWMKEGNLSSKKIFLINGTEPISLTATLKGSKVEITKAGKVLYRFTMDSKGFVTQFEFVPLNQSLQLVDKQTDTTRANSKKITTYMQQNGVAKL
ncbi:hypothetical protein [Aliivibrio kagoshimensis]|uniref:hypothetical protein n=1 Tax=Aliivibrio kagoshimensis TaxID=2910230 RepID=UPI003D0ECB1C